MESNSNGVTPNNVVNAPSPFSPSQTQGRFIQRLQHLEDENRSLKLEINRLKSWKGNLEAWLIDSFGYPGVIDLEAESAREQKLSSQTVKAETVQQHVVKLEFPNKSPQSSSHTKNGVENGSNSETVSITPLRQNNKTSSSKTEAPQTSTSNKVRSVEKNTTPGNSANNSEVNSRYVFSSKDSEGEGLFEGEDPTPCDVCRSHVPEPPSNNMIYCESCNVCVHQACYGVDVIPKGEWKCQTCVAGIEPRTQVCRFCTQVGGAMVRVKTPNNTTWAHLSCTWWIPGVSVNDPKIMDMVVGLPKVDKRRWKLLCYICKEGRDRTCCIQCSFKRCSRSFHVTCAFEHGLRMEMIDDDSVPDGIVFYSFCPLHSDLEHVNNAWVPRKSLDEESPTKKRRKTSPPS